MYSLSEQKRQDEARPTKNIMRGPIRSQRKILSMAATVTFPLQPHLVKLRFPSFAYQDTGQDLRSL